MIETGRREFVIDLSECELMDSTFMGTLAGLALHLRELGEGRLQVVQANERNAGLLRNLGLDQIFTVRALNDPDCPDLPPDIVSTPETTLSQPAAPQEMLEAHEALIAADQANASRFRDVVDLLQRDQDKQGNP
jgi:anti-sigma B factor antagonist